MILYFYLSSIFIVYQYIFIDKKYIIFKIICRVIKTILIHTILSSNHDIDLGLMNDHRILKPLLGFIEKCTIKNGHENVRAHPVNPATAFIHYGPKRIISPLLMMPLLAS